MLTTCIDCGKEKKPTFLTQSFQCDICYQNLILRLSKIAPKKEYMSKRDKIKMLLNKGKTVKEISKEIECHINYVYEIKRKLAQ